MKKIENQISILLMTTLLFMLSGCSNFTNSSAQVAIGEGSGKGKTISLGVQQFSAEQFDKIQLQSEAMNIQISQGESDEASVELRIDDTLQEKISLEHEIKDQTLHINVNEKSQIAKDSSGERTLLLTLPASENKSISVENAFGTIMLSDVILNSISLKQNAGNIEVSNATGKLNIEVNAGNINVKNAPNNFDIVTKVDAGNITIGYAEAPEQAQYDLATEVGKVKLDIEGIQLEEKTTNKVKGSLGKEGPSIQAKTSVGNIEVK